jgi:hypothetical protein
VLHDREHTRRSWDTVGPDDAASFRWQHLYKAPLLVVCLSNKQAHLDRYAEPDKGWTDRSGAHWPAPCRDIDTGMAAMLMLLTAVDAGLGALFVGVPPEEIGRPARRSAFPPSCTRSAPWPWAILGRTIRPRPPCAVGVGRRPRSSTGAAGRLSWR